MVFLIQANGLHEMFGLFEVFERDGQGLEWQGGGHASILLICIGVWVSI
jgi:hypothetical protein